MDNLSQDDRKERLQAIRKELKKNGLDGFIIPRTDAHQGEYVASQSERLAWATGFTGSAGFSLLSTQNAAIFSDSRYSLQMRQQCPAALFEYRDSTQDSLTDWFAETLPAQSVIGADPWLHTYADWQRLEKDLSVKNLFLRPTDNMVDLVWRDRPDAPKKPITPHDITYAGQTHAEKRAEIAEFLQKESAETVILTQGDSIAWLLNIRGQDLPCTPIPLCFAFAHKDGSVDLFIAPEQTTPDLTQHLGTDIRCHDITTFASACRTLQGTIAVDPNKIPAIIAHDLEDNKDCTLHLTTDPCVLPKALKNTTEIDGARQAHFIDGIAITKFLCWLDAEAAQNKTVTELGAVKKLRAFREQNPDFKDDSFDTISGAAENGAIVHYRVTEESNRPLTQNDLYLCDSGGQYPFGTTDITRTILFGQNASADMINDYTRVLKGHIQLSRSQFPAGTDGKTLDCLARAPLWEDHKDYGHGTGHGVGSYLSVHEGPQGIHKRATTPLQKGMIISNEPGYYREGHYGIRIENLITVTSPSEAGFQQFETLTLAPYDRRLIDPALLETQDLKWLNDYHHRVYQTLSPHLSPQEQKWLAQATAPIKKPKAPRNKPKRTLGHQPKP